MYFCNECGCIMIKADDEVLVCPRCDHSVNIEDYGNEEDFEDTVPDFIIGQDDDEEDEDDEYGEYYDPEIDE